ncbi:MAG: two-component system sensor histidine kinase NtrB [bacterium]
MLSMKNIQKILDSLHDVIMVVDRDYRITVANKNFADMVGTTVEEVIGKYCYEMSFNRTAGCINNCPMRGIFENGFKKTISHSHTFWDGSERYEEITFSPIKDRNGKVILVLEIIKDLTENKKIEKQLIHSEKLACMGEIAANLSHEINNPLGIITGFVQRVLSKIKEEDNIFEEMKIIEQECLRCSRILRDLLNFARPGRIQKSICNLTDVVRVTIHILDNKLKDHHIEVIEDIGDTPIYVKIDLNQFQQVLINIFLNAIHAMPKGGKLHIGLKERGDLMKKMIELMVKDEGCGIHPSHLDKIFDPFFSTKAEEGTGLGLSLSRRIIEAHGGRIDVKSELDEGTSLIIHLPLTEKEENHLKDKSLE